MTKNRLRKKHLAMRDAIGEQLLLSQSALIVKHLCDGLDFQSKDCLFIYKAFRSEVNLSYFEGCDLRVAMPQVVSKTDMQFRRIDERTEYSTSEYGVKEPISGSIVIPTKDSVILVPGSCFDLLGNRIGYGGGYYDRYLQQHHEALTIGVTMEQHVVESLPVEVHDVVLDGLVTEKGLRMIKG